MSLSAVNETISSDNIVIQGAELGDLHLSVEAYNVNFDTSPLFVGLPNDRCHCPHWGYMLSGQIYVEYGTDEEKISTGDVFYLEPEHTVEIEDGTKYVAFSPTEEFREMMDVVVRNFEKVQ